MEDFTDFMKNANTDGGFEVNFVFAGIETMKHAEWVE